MFIYSNALQSATGTEKYTISHDSRREFDNLDYLLELIAGLCDRGDLRRGGQGNGG
jgi:hypothetical protein